MGMTMSFFQIRDRGFSREQLQTVLQRGFTPGQEILQGAFGEAVQRRCSEEQLRQIRQTIQSIQKFRQARGPVGRSDQLPSPMVACCPKAEWLPFYAEDLCDGYLATGAEVLGLSSIFEAPVIGFWVCDSDMMMFLYADAAQGVTLERAKANIKEMDEEAPASTEFPQLLCELCPSLPEKDLRDLWEKEEIFAEDRVYHLCEALGTAPLYGSLPLPEGYEAVTLP